MKKLLQTVSGIIIMALAVPATAFAHVVVKPAQVAPASFQTFTTSVPNEKDQPTINVRLVIPEGLKHVSPTVKPGWQINVTKSGEGEDATVTAIEWSGGSIGAGFRDDFTFSAQVPANETTLIWKAYQTYQDGTVVSWDQEPKEDHASGSTPYSQTKIAETEAATTATTPPAANNRSDIAIALSGLALVFAIALPLIRKNK